MSTSTATERRELAQRTGDGIEVTLAIPRDNDDTKDPMRIQAIANTASFHFAFIEQGGSSPYTTLLHQVSSVEVLRIVASIGGTEIDHFLAVARQGVKRPCSAEQCH